jgi:hypothetical protein
VVPVTRSPGCSLRNPDLQKFLLCSGAAYWPGGTGSPGYIYTLGRISGGLKKFSLAGNTLTLAGVAATVGNFTKFGGALPILNHMLYPSYMGPLDVVPASQVQYAAGAFSQNMRLNSP